MYHIHHKRLFLNQHGQSVVFVLAFLGVIILSVIFLYRSGQLVSEKMELQNAADAAAYSATTLEARALNFSAYTNRAMIGNEVGIGQIVGLISLSEELVSVRTNTNILLELIADIPIAGEIIDAFLEPTYGALADIFGEVGEGMQTVLNRIAEPIIKGLSTINKVYSITQEVYHITTFALATDAILTSLEDNTRGTSFDNIIDGLTSPDDKDAQLSGYGLIALGGHFPSYYNGFTKRYSGYSNKKENKKGMGRLAATIREGRDAFSSGLNCEKINNRCESDGLNPKHNDICCDNTNPHCISQNRAWYYGFDLGTTLDLKAAELSIDLYLETKSKGGSEIRYVDDTYVWSAVDTAVLEGGFKASAEALGVNIVDVDIAIDLPLGVGTSQLVGKNKDNKDVSLSASDMNRALQYEGTPPAYGGAAGKGHGLAWDVAEEEITLGENKIKNATPGLRAYRNITNKSSNGYSFEAPYFLVGVIRKLPPIEKRGPTFGDTYQLKHGGHNGFNRVAAIAKSEVFFSRPNNSALSYFQRKDTFNEQANIFSPFWQSRLVESTDMDRFYALAMQQKVIWIPDEDAAALADAEKMLASLRKLLDTVM